jgi:hypothetical protein
LADLSYAPEFGAGQGLRPHIRVEMSFQAPALPAVARPIRSLIATARREPPEVSSFPCVDPVETAADKLSALAWRVRTWERGDTKDDPTIIRHLHDLSALESAVSSAPNFRELVRAAIAADLGRGGEAEPPRDPAFVLADMLRRLETDALWAREYEQFLAAVSFAPPDEEISFSEAHKAGRRLVDAVFGDWS